MKKILGLTGSPRKRGNCEIMLQAAVRIAPECLKMARPGPKRSNGIPPVQVIGSSIKTKFARRDGKPVRLRRPEINFIDDKAGQHRFPDLFQQTVPPAG